MMKDVIMKCKLYLGKCRVDPKGWKVHDGFVEWELRQTKEGTLEFSASGEVWERDRSDIILGGQCLDTLMQLYPKNKVLQMIHRLWEQYHLNTMQAGTPEQMKVIKEARRVSGGRLTYEEECGILKAAGLYEVKLPPGIKATGGFPDDVVSGKRGYRYGERWVHMELPQSVVDELRTMVEEAEIKKLLEA